MGEQFSIDMVRIKKPGKPVEEVSRILVNNNTELKMRVEEFMTDNTKMKKLKKHMAAEQLYFRELMSDQEVDQIVYQWEPDNPLMSYSSGESLKVEWAKIYQSAKASLLDKVREIFGDKEKKKLTMMQVLDSLSNFLDIHQEENSSIKAWEKLTPAKQGK